MFSGVGGRRDWAVSWPPIGSSSPLTPWYVWNVSPFPAQSQPARFQVETRQEREGRFLGVCVGGGGAGGARGATAPAEHKRAKFDSIRLTRQQTPLPLFHRWEHLPQEGKSLTSH